MRPPSPWILRFAPLVPAGAPVLDLAAGDGRHSRLFLRRGHPVTAADRDVSGLTGLDGRDRLEVIEADLEDGSPWPLAGRAFGGVVVTNYLWRPLFEPIIEAVDEGGVLIYATFMTGQERFGRPTDPDFLLRPGELLEVVRGRLQVVAFEQGLDRAGARVRQRICAVRSWHPCPVPPEPRSSSSAAVLPGA